MPTANIGNNEIILERDGQPALRNVQDEVQRHKEAPAILDN